MEAPKLTCIFVLALWLCGCQLHGTCTLGDEAGCPEGAFCYAGQKAKAGDVGVCTRSNTLPEGGNPPGEEGKSPGEEAKPPEKEGESPDEEEVDEVVAKRLACSAQTEGLLANAVTQPLVRAGKHLVFASSVGEGATPENNSLYFFDTAACALHSRVYVGTLTGPMVALGGSGRIAIAVGTGKPPEQQDVSHLYLADAKARLENTVSPTIDGTYEHGLSLLGIGNADGTDEAWFFAASKYARNWMTGEYNSCLTAYFPNKDKPMERLRDSSPQSRRFRAPLSHIASSPDAWTVLTHAGAASSAFVQSYWDFGLSAGWSSAASSLRQGYLFWMAIAGEEAWENAFLSQESSPAVIDEQRRAYAVDTTAAGNAWRLQRFEWGVDTAQAWSPLFDEAPVGTPLLGEPLPHGAAEVYVVTEKGTVLAFNAESLALLWKAPLRMEVSRKAQPLLAEGNLWVVGMQGQVRALRIESTGLSHKAHWPKAFGDNCNTSSKLVRPSNMPSCF